MSAPPFLRSTVAALATLVIGAVICLIGLFAVVSLGPSGRVQAEERVAGPGVAVIGKGILRATSVPVRIQVKAEKGDVTLVRALDDDARAVVESARHVNIDGVSFFPRSVESSEVGNGALPRALNADTFLAAPSTSGSVDLEVAPSQLPQALLVFPGAPGKAGDSAIDITMTWSNSAWFWHAVAVLLTGALIAGGGTFWWLNVRGAAPQPSRGGRGRLPGGPAAASTRSGMRLDRSRGGEAEPSSSSRASEAFNDLRSKVKLPKGIALPEKLREKGKMRLPGKSKESTGGPKAPTRGSQESRANRRESRSEARTARLYDEGKNQ